MLDKLLSRIAELQQLAGALAIRITVAEWQAHSLLLQLEVKPQAGQHAAERWEVSCNGVCECGVDGRVGGSVEVESSAGHPVLMQHTDIREALFFEGGDPHVFAAIGALWASHRKVAGSWIPFERYFNHETTLEQRIAGGHGKIAEGPRFLLRAYSEALDECGAITCLVASGGPDYHAPEAPAGRQPLHLLKVGASLIIAESFACKSMSPQSR